MIEKEGANLLVKGESAKKVQGTRYKAQGRSKGKGEERKKRRKAQVSNKFPATRTQQPVPSNPPSLLHYVRSFGGQASNQYPVYLFLLFAI